MPRQYVSVSISQLEKKKVVIFTDASEVAIAAVAYIYGKEQSGDSHVFSWARQKYPRNQLLLCHV